MISQGSQPDFKVGSVSIIPCWSLVVCYWAQRCGQNVEWLLVRGTSTGASRTLWLGLTGWSEVLLLSMAPVLSVTESRLPTRKWIPFSLARAGETSACWKIFLAHSVHFCPNIFYSFACPASLYCVHYVYIHTYLTVYRLYMNYHCYQITLRWNICTQIGAVRSVDWIFIVGGQFYAVTGPIRDIGQSVLQASFETGSSSSPVTATFCLLEI